MKSAVVLFFVMGILSISSQAQHRYRVIFLDTLGGTYGTAQQMNSKGLISGDANLAGDQTEHATFWRDGVITDLGTLGGANSAADQVNERGVIVGVSQTAIVDPLGENWGSALTCSASGATCNGSQNLLVAVKRQNGSIVPLPTLGGNNANVGFTSALNNKVKWSGGQRMPLTMPIVFLHRFSIGKP